MIVFTIIGVLVFWTFCWQMGYLIAMACDAKARIDDLCNPMTNELEVLIAALSVSGEPRSRRGGEQ